MEFLHCNDDNIPVIELGYVGIVGYCAPIWWWAPIEFVVLDSLPAGAVSQDNSYQMV